MAHLADAILQKPYLTITNAVVHLVKFTVERMSEKLEALGGRKKKKRRD